MAKHLTMYDADTLLDSKKVHVVVELKGLPVVTCVTTDYKEAKSVCIREENTVMLTLNPETIAKVKAGEILEFNL